MPLPPNEVTDINWCLQADNTIKVTGRLVRTIPRSPVTGYPVQIKIYEAGKGDPPFKPAKFATTGVDGTFTVEFPAPLPTSGTSYLINTVYKYENLLFQEKWKIKDFFVGDPPSCAR